jgi:hypothetical protein
MSKGKNEYEAKESEKVPEEKKTLTLEEQIAAAVGKAIEAALPIAAGVAARSGQEARAAAAPPAKRRSLGGKCVGCRQYITACKGKHRKAVVYPKDPYWARHFQGIKINGVVYCSNNGRHLVTVPEDCSIENDVAKFESKERDLFQKKYRVHNSGDVRNPRKDHWKIEKD